MDNLDVLARRLPDGTVSTDPEVLRDRAADSWALALLRRSRGDELPVPAAVVFPARTEEVATTLAWANEAHVAVIPRGAGSGVCGGAAMPGEAACPRAARPPGPPPGRRGRCRSRLDRARPIPDEPGHRRRPGLRRW